MNTSQSARFLNYLLHKDMAEPVLDETQHMGNAIFVKSLIFYPEA